MFKIYKIPDLSGTVTHNNQMSGGDSDNLECPLKQECSKETNININCINLMPLASLNVC